LESAPPSELLGFESPRGSVRAPALSAIGAGHTASRRRQCGTVGSARRASLSTGRQAEPHPPARHQTVNHNAGKEIIGIVNFAEKEMGPEIS